MLVGAALTHSSRTWEVSRAQNLQASQIRMGRPRSIWQIRVRPLRSHPPTSPPNKTQIASSNKSSQSSKKRGRNRVGGLQKSQKKMGAMRAEIRQTLRSLVNHLRPSERHHQQQPIKRGRQSLLGQLQSLLVQMMVISSLITLRTRSSWRSNKHQSLTIIEKRTSN